MKNLDVVILCGGKGKRLQAFIKDRPKPMAEINGRPFLDILFDYVSGYGAKRIILCAGYMADVIRSYYRNKNLTFELVISEEKVPLGTGGAIRDSQGLVKTSSLLVMNGDCFCPINLNNFVGFHEHNKALLSIAVTETDNPADYGSILLDKDNKIIRFGEKDNSAKSLINTGMYLFKKDVLSLIPNKTPCSLEYDFFPNLVGKDFYGFIIQEPFIDIGTPERFKQAQGLLGKLRK
ncbi:MAG: nucleotidyltransferase family protein [Candidatus Omnitrophota bacterium]